MRIWKDNAEKKLLLLVVGISVLLILVQIRLPLAVFLDNTLLGDFLTANATSATVSDLLTGLVSAYIFYIFIDYIPRHRKEQKLKNALNTIVASILNAYQQARVFGHECEITHYSNEVLTPAWLSHNKNVLKENRATYGQMLFALYTAHSRIEDFRHSLPMAVNLSPEHALKWLVITDKLRLLFELYSQVPSIPSDKHHLINLNTEENPILDFKSSLSDRLFAFFEKAEEWIIE